MNSEDKILKKLEEHDDQFKKIDKKFLSNDEAHSKIVKKLLEHDDKFEEIHQELRDTKNELMGKMDEVLTIVQRNDIERVANVHRLDRMQGEIDENKLEIRKVKKVLKVA